MNLIRKLWLVVPFFELKTVSFLEVKFLKVKVMLCHFFRVKLFFGDEFLIIKFLPLF